MSIALRYTVIETADQYAVRDNHADPLSPFLYLAPGVSLERLTPDLLTATRRCADLNAQWLVEERKDVNAELNRLADERAPLTMAEICADGCNIPDHTIRMEIARFMERFDSIDVSDFADENGYQDVEKWEHVAGGRGSERFEVREIPDPDFEPENEADETPSIYAVIDTENGDDVIETFGEDEDDAQTEADQRNREAFEESLYGFPFAHNHGFVIESFDVDYFADAGFLVWRYNDDKLIAGIDGCGYSFAGAHHAPLFYARAKAGGWLVETSTGPRRVA